MSNDAQRIKPKREYECIVVAAQMACKADLAALQEVSGRVQLTCVDGSTVANDSACVQAHQANQSAVCVS